MPFTPYSLSSKQMIANHLESLVSKSTLVLSEAFPGTCPHGEAGQIHRVGGSAVTSPALGAGK